MSAARLLYFGVAALALTSPLRAQSMQGMDHSSMPGMSMPKAPPAPKTSAPVLKAPEKQKPASASQVAPPMDHGSMQGLDMGQDGDSPAECSPEHAKMGHCTPANTNPDGSVAANKSDTEMPGMEMGDAPSMESPGDPDCPPEHAKMGHCTPKAAAMPMGEAAPTGTDQEPGNAPAPTPPADWYADRIYPQSEMSKSRDEMMKENGAQTLAFISFNLAEYQARQGRDGFRWDGEAWYGGDISRVTVKSEGEAVFGSGVEEAEVQLLYSRAVDPYFNLQAGLRQDVGKGPKRTYATIGFEGLAPYWFEVEGALFLSNKGDLLGRLEGYYDQRITQRLILQPRAELDFALQDVPESGIGSGLSTGEVGLRLRYEIVKEFAPYIGIEWSKKFGDTGRFARLAGDDPSVTNFVAGIRFWF